MEIKARWILLFSHTRSGRKKYRRPVKNIVSVSLSRRGLRRPVCGARRRVRGVPAVSLNFTVSAQLSWPRARRRKNRARLRRAVDLSSRPVIFEPNNYLGVVDARIQIVAAAINTMIRIIDFHKKKKKPPRFRIVSIHTCVNVLKRNGEKKYVIKSTTWPKVRRVNGQT